MAGKLIAQSNRNYSNTLSTRETPTFKKAGTVKIKVVYSQFLNLQGNLETYNSEKIINVTDDSKPTPPSNPPTTNPPTPQTSNPPVTTNPPAKVNGNTIRGISGLPLIPFYCRK